VRKGYVEAVAVVLVVGAKICKEVDADRKVVGLSVLAQ